ncbi:hypothetical protein C0Q70_03393 [Pomacea canaliculata]|uniref:Ig-like domain-containing protein n=1 Tax=Pomacea canaliculata TaxID=400727 RepID=A0A2T7PSP3_POMCA|nr:hypothetical protein C0Q70_03393 [Pomacea canaliculata]
MKDGCCRFLDYKQDALGRISPVTIPVSFPIRGCHNETIFVFEDSPATFTCTNIPRNAEQNVSYAETTELSNQTGREYLENWTCSFSQPLPRDEGIYNYTISADTFQIQGYSSTITVETPGYLSTTCPEVIEEGKSLRCQCETNRTGTPPGLVLWDGYKSDTLEIENVRLENNGSNFTCLLVWRNDTYRVLLYSLTVTQTVASTSPTGGDASASSQGFPMLLVILGAVGAVLVITVVAILVVCITRRRRGKQQGVVNVRHRGRMNLKGRDREEKPVNDTAPSAPTKDGQDFEDHVNVLYGGCADLRTNQSNDLAENMDATYAVVDKARLKNREHESSPSGFPYSAATERERERKKEAWHPG